MESNAAHTTATYDTDGESIEPPRFVPSLLAMAAIAALLIAPVVTAVLAGGVATIVIARRTSHDRSTSDPAGDDPPHGTLEATPAD